MRCYLPLIRKDSSTPYAWSHSLCEGRISLCMGLISRKLCSFLFMFSSGITSLSFLLLFPLSIPFFCLCAWFLILFHLTYRIFQKKHSGLFFIPKLCRQQDCYILLTPIWIQMNDLLRSSR